MLVDGAPVHVVLYGLECLTMGHGAQEGTGVGMRQLAILELLGLVLLVRFAFVIVLDLGAHSNK